MELPQLIHEPSKKTVVSSSPDSFLPYSVQKLDFDAYRSPLTVDNLQKLSDQASALPAQEIFGYFYDDEHYARVLQLAKWSTDAHKHLKLFLHQHVLPRVRSKTHVGCWGMDDVGLMRLLARSFQKIHVLDHTRAMLTYAKQGLMHASKNDAIHFAHQQALSVHTTQPYNMALVSRLLYHYDWSEQCELIQKIYQQLAHQGMVVLALTGEGDKDHLLHHFDGNVVDVDKIVEYCSHTLDAKIHLFNCHSHYLSFDLNTMLHVLGLWLYDGGSFVTREDLQWYLHHYHQGDRGYHLQTKQTFIMLQKMQ